MSLPLNNSLFFLFTTLTGLTMIGEGLCVVRVKTPVTPLPSWILYALGSFVVGSERSRQRFTCRASSKQLRTYAICDLVLGLAILVSSVVYLAQIAF